MKAIEMLIKAADTIGSRASERDTGSERSMAATVGAFNAMFGTEITETQGWMFMGLLKMSRAKGGRYREDDYVDGAAYFALAGECEGVKAKRVATIKRFEDLALIQPGEGLPDGMIKIGEWEGRQPKVVYVPGLIDELNSKMDVGDGVTGSIIKSKKDIDPEREIERIKHEVLAKGLVEPEAEGGFMGLADLDEVTLARVLDAMNSDHDVAVDQVDGLKRQEEKNSTTSELHQRDLSEKYIKT